MSGFNSKIGQFAWKHFTIIVEGRPIAGATDIEYGTEKTLEHIFGAGDKPQFIGEGNKVPTGSIEMLQNDFEALVEEAKKRGGDDLTDLEVSITVVAVPKDPAQLQKTIADRLIGVKFQSGKKKISQGQTHMKVSMPFLCLDIVPQI